MERERGAEGEGHGEGGRELLERRVDLSVTPRRARSSRDACWVLADPPHVRLGGRGSYINFRLTLYRPYPIPRFHMLRIY